MKSDRARETYEEFKGLVAKEYGDGTGARIKDGVFGAMMDVALVNDGPVTLVIDSSVEASEARTTEGEGVVAEPEGEPRSR
jgi:D-aminoacyl-tRNA deacylase|eukprot:6742919-Prymnesium_polylepis.1